MGKVIIAIHGLGNKPAGKTLEKWWKMAILEGLEKAGRKADLPRFEMIYWADILYPGHLDETVTDRNSPLYFREKYIESSDRKFPETSKARQKIHSLIDDAMNNIFLNDDYTLNFEGLTDSILKKYFSDLHIYYNINSTTLDGGIYNARDLIRNRASSVLKKYRGHDIFLIAHSMGSIIAFDVLKFQVPDIKINTFATIGSPLGLPVVLGKIAAENRSFGNSDTSMSAPPGITGHWYNFSDPLDRIAFDFRLSDDFSPNSYGVEPVDFIVTNDYEIEGIKNPHKSYGYLRTPEFSEALSDFISGEKKSFFTFLKNKYHNLLKKMNEVAT